jgi:hypothetical protein
MKKLWSAVLGLMVVGVGLSGAPASAPYGDYPNCIAPAIPLEQHGWWQQNTDTDARHIHIAACLPNARDTTGELVSVSGVQPFNVRVMIFNNPDPVTSVRWSWESAIKQEVKGTWQCPGSHGDHRECQVVVPLQLDTRSAPDGLRELRLTQNLANNVFGQRHFGTLNFQLFVKNGASPSSNYRSRVDPIARSWYTDLEYANVQVNYMSLFAGGVGGVQLDRSVPQVSGTVALNIKHDQTMKSPGSELWLDADFHRFTNDWTEAAVGVPQRVSGATLLYRRPGLFEGTYLLDTRRLSNGRHSLYFQTTDRDATGIHASALKVFIDVAN